jgi:HD-like signal output (HDOD) protein
MPDVMRETIASSRDHRQLYHQAERMLLGFDHAEVGAALFRNWKIPASIFEPVACHHLPRNAKQFPLEAAVIHLADIICQGLELGSSAEWCVTTLDHGAWQRLGLPAGVLDTIIRQSEPQIEETCAILAEDT